MDTPTSQVETEKKLKTTSRILVVNEDDYTQYLDASTDEVWATSALYLLTTRHNLGYVYHEPELSTDVEAALKITDEDIEQLPTESLQLKARQDRNQAQQEHRVYLADKKWWDAMEEVVDNQDDSLVTLAKGKRHEQRVPRAWLVLRERNDYEYENVELENIQSYS